jgi:hypothetical protein
MRLLSNTEILDIWDRGWDVSSPQRALMILSIACQEIDIDNLASYSVGTRDMLLIKLRSIMFGRNVMSLTKCRKCNANVEILFNADDLLNSAQEPQVDQSGCVAEQGYLVNFRLPNSKDQIAIIGISDPCLARSRLTERCVVSVSHHNIDVSPSELPDNLVNLIGEQMSELDPLASVFLSVVCPECDNKWQALFDICDFLWRELSYRAQRLIGDIHLLASVYGWNEAQILALNERRRLLYVVMCKQ